LPGAVGAANFFKLSRGIVLIHDNARPHTARQKQTLLHDAFHWDTFDLPLYSPDLAPSDFYLFSKMKEHLDWLTIYRWWGPTACCYGLVE